MKIIVNESQFKKLILKKDTLKEQHTTDSLYVKLSDEHSKDMLKKIAKIANYDEDKLEDLQHELSLGLHNKHNSNFMDTLNHNLHAYFNPYSNYVHLEFPHLGPHHDIKVDVETSFGHHDSHGNEPLNLELHPTFGATVKIPLHFNSNGTV